MQYRTLGRTGFQVSDISFDTGNLTNSNVLAVALDMGMTYIDTAEHFVNGQAERAVGEVIKDRDRGSIFLTTKLNLSFGGSTKEALKDRFCRCLERMRTDYADCLMIHMTPRAEEVKHEPYHQAIAELKAEGKVRFTGLSNHGIQHSIFGRIEDPMENVIGAVGRFSPIGWSSRGEVVGGFPRPRNGSSGSTRRGSKRRMSSRRDTACNPTPR